MIERARDQSVDAAFAPSEGRASPAAVAALPAVPDYLREVYYWAYLSPLGVALLDRQVVVTTILWGNDRRLRQAAFAELAPDDKVLQPACVYGNFSVELARHLDPRGRLDVIDVAPIQVRSCRRKLHGLANARVFVADAAAVNGEVYDAVCCFFLLHEIPDDYKRRVVNRLLGLVRPGGKVVFVDYHRPRAGHPLKGITALVFRYLEPFARRLWEREIRSFADSTEPFDWRKETYFGGLFQKVVAARRP